MPTVASAFPVSSFETTLFSPPIHNSLVRIHDSRPDCYRETTDVPEREKYRFLLNLILETPTNMNKSILVAIVAAFTIITYLVLYYLLGFEQKKALIVTGAAFLAMVIPELIRARRSRG